MPSALEAHNARAAAGRHRQDLLGVILTPSSLAKVGFLRDAVKVDAVWFGCKSCVLRKTC